MSYTAVGPLPTTERIATLDIVRGFALLGILIMNMPGYSNSFFIEADGSHLWTHPIDRGAELLREMLFSGKFNSMFSLLFGIGFTIQYQRMRERAPAEATALYLRRLAVLLALGLVHAMVFWTGDVLHIYALLGLALLLALRSAPDRVIFLLIGLCLVYPVVSGVLRIFLMTPEITARLLIALVLFFVIQVPWSVWWLRSHDQGPLEKLWRRATYGRRAPSRSPVLVT